MSFLREHRFLYHNEYRRYHRITIILCDIYLFSRISDPVHPISVLFRIALDPFPRSHLSPLVPEVAASRGPIPMKVITTSADEIGLDQSPIGVPFAIFGNCDGTNQQGRIVESKSSEVIRKVFTSSGVEPKPILVSSALSRFQRNKEDKPTKLLSQSRNVLPTAEPGLGLLFQKILQLIHRHMSR